MSESLFYLTTTILMQVVGVILAIYRQQQICVFYLFITVNCHIMTSGLQ